MKELIKSISLKEWRFVAVMAVVMILITGLPYLFGYLTASEGTAYNGLHALSPGDIPIYYSYINQVENGNFFVKNLFTSEPQAIGTFNAWWSIVGILANFFNLSVILAFQLSRLLMIPVFVFFAYLFISYFLNQEIQRKVCLIFLLFSTGVGFYFAGFLDLVDFQNTTSYWWPIDLWLTEAITFNALFQTSHFIASITLTILIFLLMLLAFEKKKFSYAVISGVLTLFYFNFHPYYLPVIFGVLGVYLFILILQVKKILWREVGYLLTVFLISLPSVIYHVWLIKASPVVGQRVLQNVTTISPLPFVAIGYGFLLLGFVLGLFFLSKNKAWNKRFGFLLIWFGVNVVLIYSPFPFHSRYTQGLHIIFAIFTVVGLFYLRDYLKARLKSQIFDFWVENSFLLFFLFVVLFSTSNLYSVFRDFYYFYVQPEKIKTKLYLPKDFFIATDWLGTLPKSQVILAADIPSKFIPGFSGQVVYLAHAHETLFFYSKVVYLNWFFADNRNNKAKKQFLNQQRINFVFYSDYEKELGEFNPADKDYLKLVFDSPKAQIYQVIKD